MPRSRKERGHSGGYYRSLRSTVFLEETHCFLCGHLVDQSLHYLDPWAPQLHYVIPVTRGGNQRDRNNAHLTHRDCNGYQSNRLPGERPSLRKPRDRWIDGEEP